MTASVLNDYVPCQNVAEAAQQLLRLCSFWKMPKPKNSSNFYLEQSKKPNEHIILNEVAESEVNRIILKLPNKTSLGPDGLSNKMLKRIAKFPSVIKSLTNCINKSIREETYPDILKLSKISPVFKKGSVNNPNNYRPIAQLSPLSKVFECSVMEQVIDQVERESILDKNQFGFCKFHSTWNPLLLTVNYIQKEIKAKKHVVLISCDLAKAFDTCRTDGTLQNKISYFCDNQSFVNWIDSCYQNRGQYTTCNNVKSNVLNNFPISIVQGSSIGPKIFNFYINDLAGCSNLYTDLFADDTNFVQSHNDHLELEKVVNTELDKIKDYFDSNGLTISIDKTSYLHFKPTGQLDKKIKLFIGSKQLREVSELTFLGVILDNRLSFRSHFEKVYNKTSKGLRGLIMVKKFLSYKAKVSIYYSLIHSHLIYCNLIWHNFIKKSQMNKLIVMQKKAVRAIFDVKYNCHTNKLFEISKIDKIQNIFRKESILTIFKYQNNTLPSAIKELFDESINHSKIITRSFSSSTLQPKKEIMGLNICEIIENWNRAGFNIRQINSFKELKIKVSRMLNLEFEECEKISCYSCTDNLNRMSTIMKKYNRV